MLDKLLRRIQQGSLRVTYWDGDSRVYGDDRRPAVHVMIKTPKVLRAIAKNPSIGAGESYMDGNLVIEGPLDKLAELGHANRQILENAGAKKFYSGFNRNIKRLQQKHVSHHYDLGNDFYKLWLDKETLGYTCSYYKKPSDSLEKAQVQKYDHILNKLRIEPKHRILDIGFGWGYFLIRAAKRFGVRGLGVSLSREQYIYAVEWARREHVDKLVTFKLMNYQDLPKLNKKFDRIVSIGFFEHVGKGNHDTYFKIIDTMLTKDGISFLQSITHQKELNTDAWIDKYIFPGGYIPSIRETTSLMAHYNFIIKDYENLGPHYVRTLEEWWRRFEKNKSNVIAMYDERFYRMWRLYLSMSIGAFRTGSTSLSQWTFTRLPGNDWPLTREYIYK